MSRKLAIFLATVAVAHALCGVPRSARTQLASAFGHVHFHANPGSTGNAPALAWIEGDNLRLEGAATSELSFPQHLVALGRVVPDRDVLELGTRPRRLGAILYSPAELSRRAADRLETRLVEVLPQPAAGLAIANVVGRRELLARDASRAYRDAGVLHVLAISGVHLALLALFLRALLGAAGVPPRMVGVVLILGAAAYAPITGGNPPVVRCALMLALTELAYLVGRRPDRWCTFLLVLATMLAFQPAWIADIGFQLSFGAVAAIQLCCGARARDPDLELARRLLPPVGRIRHWLVESMTASIAVWIAVEPVVAYHFHRINLVAILGNLAVAPIASITLAGDWLCLCPGLGELVAPLVSLSARAELAAADLVSRLPGLRVIVQAPTLAQMLTYYTLMGALLVWGGRKCGRLCLLVALSFTLLWVSAGPREGTLDVPCGRTTLRVSCLGGTVEVDAGTAPADRACRTLVLHGIGRVDRLRVAADAKGWDGALAFHDLWVGVLERTPREPSSASPPR